MRKMLVGLMVLSVLLLMACQPAAQPAAPAAPAAQPAAPAVTAPSGQAAPSEAAPAETAPAPLENVPAPAREGVALDQVCYGLLSPEEFSQVCGREGKVVFTPKISEGSCWMNIADHQNNKLTAGFTVVDWKKASQANSEFDRGVKMRRTQGAVEGKEAGERSYQYKELGRQNIVFVRGTFLTMLAAMNDLCPPEKIVGLAQKIGDRLG